MLVKSPRRRELDAHGLGTSGPSKTSSLSSISALPIELISTYCASQVVSTSTGEVSCSPEMEAKATRRSEAVEMSLD